MDNSILSIAPTFNGSNARSFLKAIDEVTSLQNWDEKRKILLAVTKSPEVYKDLIRDLNGFASGVWADFETAFLKQFSVVEDSKSKWTIQDLQNWKQTTDMPFTTYEVGLDKIFRHLKSCQQVTDQERKTFLMKGLRDDLFNWLIDNDHEAESYDDIVASCRKWEDKEARKRNKGHPSFSQLEALKRSLSDINPTAAPITKHNSPRSSSATPGSGAGPTSGGSEMEKITRRLEELTLAQARIEDKLCRPLRQSGGFSHGEPKRVRSCLWCGEPGHFKDQCTEFQRAQSEGKVKLINHIICWPSGERMTMIPNGLKNHLTSNDTRMAVYQVDSDTKQPFETTFIQAQLADRDLSRITDQELHDLADEVKTVTGWDCPVLARDVYILAASKRKKPDDDEDVMHAKKKQNLESRPEPRVERAPKMKVTYESKGLSEVDLDALADALLDVTFSTTVRKILSASPKLLRSFTEKIRVRRRFAEENHDTMEMHRFKVCESQLAEDAQKEFGLNLDSLISDSDENNAHYRQDFYACATPIAPVSIKGVDFEALVDYGSQVCSMPKRVAEQLNLPIDPNATWGMINADGSKNILLGVCHDVPIDCGGIKVRCHIFVQREANFDLLLGCTLLRKLRTETRSLDNGDMYIRFCDPEGGRSVQFRAVSGNHPRNRASIRTLAATAQNINSVSVSRVELTDFAFLSEGETFMGTLEIRSRKDVFDEVMMNTKYKPVSKKVKPVATQLPDHAIAPSFPKSGGVTEPPSVTRLTSDRIADLKFGEQLSIEEKDLFIKMLRRREKAIAFTANEMGILAPHVEPPHVIHTVPHVPWKYRPLRFSQKENEEIIDLLKEKLRLGIIEPSCGSYANRWFCIRKKNGQLRFIQDLQPLNKVTIRDNGQPPILDEFVELFAGSALITVVDLFSGYDQFPLDEQSRDMTAISTPIGLVRMCRMPQGATNAVAAYQRVLTKVIQQHIPSVAAVFIDDIGIRSPPEMDESLVRPNVRKTVVDHIQRVEAVLKDLEGAGLTVSGLKSKFGFEKVTLLGHSVGNFGRGVDSEKSTKISSWPTPKNLKEVRGFLGIAVFYRIFIPNFSSLAKPLYDLTRKNARFRWDDEQDRAFTMLKRCLTSDPILAAPDYNVKFIVSTDASDIGMGYVLSQEKNNARRPIRFESKIFSDTQTRYATIKKELLAVKFALSKFRYYLYGRKFTLETDAKSLLWILNSVPEIPDNAMARWIAFIKMYDFEIIHIPGKKNVVADALSRRRRAESSDQDDDDEDEDDGFWIDNQELELGGILEFFDNAYDSEYKVIGHFLSRGKFPEGLSTREESRLRAKAKFFLLKGGHLFKLAKRGRMPRRVVCDNGERFRIIAACHDSVWAGHRDAHSTMAHVAEAYYWKNYGEDVKEYVKSCEQCQKKSHRRFVEPLNPTWVLTVWRRVDVDVMWLPEAKSHPYRCIVDARDGLSGWVEARALVDNKAFRVAEFLYEDVISRYGCVGQITADRGEVNTQVVRELLDRLKIKVVLTTAYHPQSNGMIERGHRPLAKSLSIACNNDIEKWPSMLHTALWADRITVKSTTGYTPYELLFGRTPVMPIEIDAESWRKISWRYPMSTEELLACRMEQLRQLPLTIDQAAESQKSARLKNKLYYDAKKLVRKEELKNR